MDLKFQFANLGEMMWMEGHGPYVWVAYLMTFCCLVGLGITARIARKNFLRLQASIALRNESENTDKSTDD